MENCPFGGFIQFIAGFVRFHLTISRCPLFLYAEYAQLGVAPDMGYDYTKKGRHYRKGDHQRRILFLLVLAVFVTGACFYIVVRH